MKTKEFFRHWMCKRDYMVIFRKLLPCAAAASLFAQDAPTVDPGRSIYNIGVRNEVAANLDSAKTAFLTVASTYSENPLADKAKNELAAICLFMEAQTQVQRRNIQAGYDTFRTVMRAFPESPVAKLAADAAQSLGFPPDPRR